jgi:murein DD-endopeptidase MepM/ murein hydrolase activator NlpD
MRGFRLAGLAAALLSLLGILPAPFAAEAPRRGTRPPSSPSPATVHRVKAGETLRAVAARHHVTVAALVAANRLPGPDARLRAGQRLTIPGGPSPGGRARRTPAATAQAALPPRALVLALPDFSELVPLFAWPVDGPVTSKFGRRRLGWHRGIDIQADLGTPVIASAGGTVVSSGFETRYGRVVKIEHPNGFMTVYAHNDVNMVDLGERVMPGQFIAAVGRTGRATSHHVHFEIRQAGLAYNPLYMLPLPPRPTLIEETGDDEHDDTDE